MTIHWKAVEFFTVVLFIFQFCPVCNFGLGTLGSKGVNTDNNMFCSLHEVHHRF